MLWNGEQEGYCGCPLLIGKEPQYLPSPSIIKAMTAVEKPTAARKHDWHSFDEADGQLQGSRLLGRHWPGGGSDWRGGWGLVRRTGKRRVRAAKNIRRLTSCCILMPFTPLAHFQRSTPSLLPPLFLWVFFSFFFWVHGCLKTGKKNVFWKTASSSTHQHALTP